MSELSVHIRLLPFLAFLVRILEKLEVVDVVGRRWICRMALPSNSDVVGTVSLRGIRSLAGRCDHRFLPTPPKYSLPLAIILPGCDAFDHPAAPAG